MVNWAGPRSAPSSRLTIVPPTGRTSAHFDTPCSPPIPPRDPHAPRAILKFLLSSQPLNTHSKTNLPCLAPSGVELPPKGRIKYSRRYIYGLAPRGPTSHRGSASMPSCRSDLSGKLEQEPPRDHRQQVGVEGDLRRDIAGNLNRLQAINCYRGSRPAASCPPRQRTTPRPPRGPLSRPWVSPRPRNF